MEHVNSSAAIRRLLLGTSALCVLGSVYAFGQPSGSSVVSGQISIATPSVNNTIITQSTQKALIEWQNFSVATGATVQFNQPNSSAITLNRVVGADASAVNGSLLANGQVWLINPNGVLFGNGSYINVGGLIATTSDITNQDFAAGNYNFAIPSGKPGAAIINQGTIVSAQGGSVVLAGKSVSNQGLVEANGGMVVLGGASTFTVDFNGDNLLSYAVTPQSTTTSDNTGASASSVTNSGKISAAGGSILLTTRAASNVVDNVINNTGMVEATSVSEQNGEIILDAGPGGTVNDSGTLDASGKSAGQTGGSISLTGNAVAVGDGALIDASGDAGGGDLAIGGNFHGSGPLPNAQTTNVGKAVISANAISTGNGGNVAIWSDGTTTVATSITAQGGKQSGNGGLVETSGATLTLADTASVNTLAPMGDVGTWLLDPTNVVVQTGGGTQLSSGTLALATDSGATDTIDPSTIITALATSSVTLEAASSLHVLSPVIYSSTNGLNLLSEGSIGIYASVQNTLASGGGAINVISGWNGVTLPPSSLTATGVFGNGSGNGISVGTSNASGGVAIGNASGTTTLAGYGINIIGTNGYAQIGYHGAGGGDIVVLSSLANINLTANTSAPDYAQIGNGSLNGDINGNITGNISVQTNDTVSNGNGMLVLNSSNNGAQDWVGNVANTGFSETGNISVIVGDLNDDNDNAGTGNGFGDEVKSDLTGGDFTLGETNPSNDQFQIGYGSSPFNYTSPHNLTLLSGGDIYLGGNFQNAGSGTITFVAGWNGTTLGAALMTTPNAYGNVNVNNNTTGSVYIGVTDPDGDVTTGSIALGSAGGTTILTNNLILDAVNGYAQLGYHGAGGGNIEVSSSGNGNIDLTAGASPLDYAQIGNGSLNGDVSGNITGNISVQSANGASTGTLSLNAPSDGGLPWIGNFANLDFGETGNVTIIVPKESDNASTGGGYVASFAKSDLAGGDFTLGYTSAASFDVSCGSSCYYTSSHNLTLLSVGGINVVGNVENAGAGAITLVAGWDGHTLTPASLTNSGVFGNNSGGITVGGTNAPSNVAIGSAGGTTTLAGASLTLTATNGYAQLGIHGGGTGALNVTTTGAVSLNGGVANGSFVQIGNGGALTTGLEGGDVSIVAGGNVTLSGGAGVDAYAQIGHGGADTNTSSNGYSNLAPITVTSAKVLLSAGGGSGSYAQIGNGGYLAGAELLGTGINSGDITVTVNDAVTLTGNGPDAYAQIGNGGAQVNLNAAVAASGSNSGNITVTAPAEGGSVSLAAGSGANAYAQIGNGGYSINASTVALPANFPISGNVSVTDLVLTGGNSGANAYAQIGNGDASLTGLGAISGNIMTSSPFTLTDGTAPNSPAVIGNFIGESPTGELISGYAFNSNGSVAVDAQVDIYSSGALLSGGATTSAANGYFYDLLPSGTVGPSTKLGETLILSGAFGVSGLTYTDQPTLTLGNIANFNVTSGTKSQITGETTLSALNADMAATFGSSVYSSIISHIQNPIETIRATSASGFTVDQSTALSGLMLDSTQGIDFNAPTTVLGAGGVILITNDGGTGGDISFGLGPNGFAGSLSFTGTPNSGQSLTVNGQAYILLYSMSDVQNINISPTSLSREYALATSLNASSVTGWVPIGTDGAGDIINSGTGFTGIFTGLGNTISNLTTNLPSVDYVGLFGYSSGAIRDVGMVGGAVNGSYYVGGLMGENNSSGTITDSYATGAVSGAYYMVGGLVGINEGTISNAYATGAVGSLTDSYYVGGLVGWNDGTISNAYATGAVNGIYYAGGLVGVNEGTISNAYATGTVGGLGGSEYVGGLAGFNDDTISNAYATGAVNGSYYAGGLVGVNEGTISNAYATGAVGGLGGSEYVGGLAGFNDDTISNAYATGAVNGSYYAGGLVGFNEGTISNAYATGAVSGGTSSYVGGLVGLNEEGTISNAYATGAVSGGTGSYVGGLVGYNEGTIASSYWDTQTSGLSTGIGTDNDNQSGNVTGLSTAQLQGTLPSGFSSSVWGTGAGLFPYLLWQTSIAISGSPPATTDITYSVSDTAGTYGTLAALGTVSLMGVSSGNASNVTGVITLYNSLNDLVTLSASLSVGIYTEVVTSLTGSAASSYVIASSGNTNGTLTINPATLNYTANAANRTYGSANPSFSGSVTGFVLSDSQSNATTGTLSFTSAASAASNVGSYAINGSGLTVDNGNYVIAQAAGNATAFTIIPATLTYLANLVSQSSGTAIPTFTGSVTGFVLSDTQSSATTGTLDFTSAATAASNAGSYAIDGSGLTADNDNYVFAQAAANATALTIGPPVVTMIATQVASNPQTIGVVAAQSVSTSAPNNDAANINVNNVVLVINPPTINVGVTAVTASLSSSPPSPISALTGNGGQNTEPPTDSDSATTTIADSLNGSSKPSISHTLILGVLRQVTETSTTNNVHGVPPADQDFSSWGNKALWQ